MVGIDFIKYGFYGGYDKETEGNPVIYPGYKEHVFNRPHTLQVSFQRCGRVWTSTLVCAVAGCKHVPIDCIVNNVDYDWESGAPAYFNAHWSTALDISDKAKFVLLIRDPRDAILSLLHWYEDAMDQYFFDCFDAIAYWCSYWKLMLDIFLPRDTLVIQYERTLLYPANTIKQIADFAGLTIKHSVFDIIHHTDKHKFGEVYRGVERYKQQAKKWRRDELFTDHHNEVIFNRLKYYMEFYGYLKDKHDTEKFIDPEVRYGKAKSSLP